MPLVKHVLCKEDFNKIRDFPTQLRDKVILSLLYDTGMRTGELAPLKTSDVDLERKEIKILDSKKKIPFKLPITNNTVELLAEYMKTIPQGWLFPSRVNNGHLTTRGCQWIIKRLACVLNLKEWESYNPRLFRYRFSRNWIQRGGNLLRLSDILRHQRVSTTSRYIARIRFQCENEQLREEYDNIMNS